MIFKVGDKVKFLDEVGEGVVSKIISANQVEVETEDGFSIPYMTKNLLRSGGLDNVDERTENEEISEEFRSEAVSPHSNKDEKNKIFLCFIPYDQKTLISGEIEMKIVNMLDFPIQFRLITKKENGEMNQIATSFIQSQESYFVKNLDRDELNDFLEGYFQILLADENGDKIYNPVNTSFKLRGSKFYKESSYKSLGFLSRNAIIYKLFDIIEAQVLDSGEASLKQDVESTKVKAQEQTYKNEILRHKVGDKTAEVDMHIWELETNHELLKKEEILSIQMGYFVKCVDSAIEHEFEKVIFIHGVGTGRLKKEIREFMDERENLSYKDASLQKYGVGATEVHIRY